MNTEMSTAEVTQKRVLFQRWQLVAAAVVSAVLWIAWGVTFRGLGLALNTTPRYFPEAPLWHMGLYFGAFITLAYACVGIAYLWLERMDQRRASSSK